MWLSKFSNQVELSVYYFNFTRLHLLKSEKNKTLSNILIDIYCILPAAIKLIQFDMCFYISWRFHCFFLCFLFKFYFLISTIFKCCQMFGIIWRKKLYKIEIWASLPKAIHKILCKLWQIWIYFAYIFYAECTAPVLSLQFRLARKCKLRL